MGTLKKDKDTVRNNTALGETKDDDAGEIELPEAELFELGEANMVKPIYMLGVPGQAFVEKVQGIQTQKGVLVRWNNVGHFFPGAILEEGDEGAYVLRNA